MVRYFHFSELFERISDFQSEGDIIYFMYLPVAHRSRNTWDGWGGGGVGIHP